MISLSITGAGRNQIYVKLVMKYQRHGDENKLTPSNLISRLGKNALKVGIKASERQCEDNRLSFAKQNIIKRKNQKSKRLN